MMISLWQTNYDIHAEKCALLKGTNQLVCKIPNIQALKVEGFAVLTEYSFPVYNTVSSLHTPSSWTLVDGNPSLQVLKERSLGGGIVVTVYDAKDL
jgi:hypothetical protein